MYYIAESIIINPRHACAARVTVVVLYVCLSTTILALRITATHTLGVEGRGGVRSRAGCPPSESSGAKVHVQPTVTAILNRFIL